ncbi:hypothetical protein [Actinoplanes sp. URMC 104]|uniref:hypothetical protein n=1 Tax=Actinoplanes sp. URMC 104 TaxID=3423409 RepID=UPI003F1B1119
MGVIWPYGWEVDLGVPDRWWERRDQVEQVLGYRRWCPACLALRVPRLHGEVDEPDLPWLDANATLGWRRPWFYQTCSWCSRSWHGAAMTAHIGLGDDDIFQLRLSSSRWWVRDSVTLEALRRCPDIRSMADMIWERMERAGRHIEVEGAYR